jgi:hypothetical protein
MKICPNCLKEITHRNQNHLSESVPGAQPFAVSGLYVCQPAIPAERADYAKKLHWRLVNDCEEGPRIIRTWDSCAIGGVITDGRDAMAIVDAHNDTTGAEAPG